MDSQVPSKDQLRRYRFTKSGMFSMEDGQWVSWSDHRAEIDRLNKKLSASLEDLQEARTKCGNLLDAVNAKQAKIDALMLEFCPGEMSAEQRAEWAKSKRVAQEPAPAASNELVAKVLGVYEPTLKRMRDGTHFEHCWQDHWSCVLDMCLAEIVRLQRELDRTTQWYLDMTAQRDKYARLSPEPGTVTNQQIDNLLFSLRSNWPAEGYERDVKRQTVRTWLAASGWGASQPPPSEVAAAAARVANEIWLDDEEDPFKDDVRVLIAAVRASQPPSAGPTESGRVCDCQPTTIHTKQCASRKRRTSSKGEPCWCGEGVFCVGVCVETLPYAGSSQTKSGSQS